MGTRSETANDSWAGVAYSVFGCGNSEWAATYQAVPTLIDRNSTPTGRTGCIREARATRGSDFDASTASGTKGLWSDIANALDLPADVAEPATPALGSRSRSSTGRSRTR